MVAAFIHRVETTKKIQWIFLKLIELQEDGCFLCFNMEQRADAYSDESGHLFRQKPSTQFGQKEIINFFCAPKVHLPFIAYN